MAMMITAISVYRTPLPYVGGAYAWGRGNVIETAYSSVVVIETDAGLTGCGEFCPCGENYMEAHSEGVVAAARLLAPALLGEDPRHVGRIEQIMDHVIRGHGYAKAPFDAACWDILGQSLNTPLYMLLGGKLSEGAPMYRVAPAKASRRDGCRDGAPPCRGLSAISDQGRCGLGGRSRSIRSICRWSIPTGCLAGG
jgi:L-alanine-DL-glutamate epimerase-like enolase superfamily enzyme